MKRILTITAAVLLGWLGAVSTSQAQVFIRAPFVRVGVGDGVYVRAPFVNLYVPPSGDPVYGPRVIYLPPPVTVTPQTPPVSEPLPIPQVQPAPAKAAVQAQTIEAFAKSFQPKAGSFETTLINPVTNQPTAVRFTLPEGTPRRVVVTRDSVEFVYRIGQWVRIEFERDGAHVTSRN